MGEHADDLFVLLAQLNPIRLEELADAHESPRALAALCAILAIPPVRRDRSVVVRRITTPRQGISGGHY